MKFRAYVSEEVENGKYVRSIKEKNIEELPKNDLLINVKYSTLNYKDALSARGHRGVSRYYPHTPGIDAAGIVVESKSPKFKSGDEVVVTGYDLGMNTAGGFAEYISVPAGWAVNKHPNLTLKECMIYGSAGITAALCVNEFEKHNINIDSGNILVTGATGGVGSMSVGILSKIGYNVIAASGKKDKYEYLYNLGAKIIISREDVFDTTDKPLLPKKWIGAIDNVGGNTLSTIFRSTDNRGIVCVVGLVESENLNINLFPFIMRGVSLIGIDSAERPIELKEKLWEKLAKEWKFDYFDKLHKEVSLDDLDIEINKMLNGEQSGKIIVKI